MNRREFFKRTGQVGAAAVCLPLIPFEKKKLRGTHLQPAWIDDPDSSPPFGASEAFNEIAMRNALQAQFTTFPVRLSEWPNGV